MIPRLLITRSSPGNFTRTSGGDPAEKRLTIIEEEILPARAGVILVGSEDLAKKVDFTRTSGGDPILILTAQLMLRFYPHERG